jgi:TRAP-type C4-dicarboxylate transport system permease small subunit
MKESNLKILRLIRNISGVSAIVLMVISTFMYSYADSNKSASLNQIAGFLTQLGMYLLYLFFLTLFIFLINIIINAKKRDDKLQNKAKKK